ncbi:exonuclease [Pectobacterium phage PP90]|nr:exonuclease [Pectobacterium phage PP90]
MSGMVMPIFDDLPEQFAPAIQGRVLLLDGDFPAYAAASTVKNLDTAVRRFQTLVETQRFLVNAESVQVHLTPTGCTKLHRDWYPTAKPYQANREGKAKPPLLQPLRNCIPTTEWESHWSVHPWLDREADDGLIMNAVLLGDRGIMCSGDKDLNLTPGPLWIDYEGRIDYIEDRFGWIKRKELTSQSKVVGHGTKFFWAQMLMGDTADNVQGIVRLNGKTCGAVGAWNALKDITSEADAAEFVLRAYIAAQQNPLAEAECLWLRRSLQDSAYTYLSELGLPDYIQQWLDSLHQYHQEVFQFKINERDNYDQDEQQSTSHCTGTQASGCINPDDLPPWEGGCNSGCRGCNPTA